MSDRYRLAPLLVLNARTLAVRVRALADAEQRLRAADYALRAAEAWARSVREHVQKERACVRPGNRSARELDWESRAAVATRARLAAADRGLERAASVRSERWAALARARADVAQVLVRETTLQRHRQEFTNRRRAQDEARDQAHADDAVSACTAARLGRRW